MHCIKLSMKEHVEATDHSLSHLGLHVGDLDPIQPPGDHRGGVGAVGGAGHRVCLVGCEWLLGKDKVTTERHQYWPMRGQPREVRTNQITAYLRPRGVYGDHKRKH